MIRGKRAYYSNHVSAFLQTPCEIVLAALEDGLSADGFSRSPEQRYSWRRTVNALTAALRQTVNEKAEASRWGIMLEYSIPSRRKRLDCVLLTTRGVIPLEFKIGKVAASATDKWQISEYCWNLRDFHRASEHLQLAPILVLTDFEQAYVQREMHAIDVRNRILPIQVVSGNDLSVCILYCHNSLSPPTKMPGLATWEDSPVSPSQSIIDSARDLFRNHSVRGIDHSHADNTDEVVEQVAEIVRFSRDNGIRSICFVTGVPGAGKTLVGLRIAYLSEATKMAESAPCFASGNLKLLRVLGKALGLNLAKTRDDVRAIIHDSSAPLWDIHQFARVHLASATSPPFPVVVFDEAQRVWTKAKVKKALETKRKRGGHGLQGDENLICSEPELLLSAMNMVKDWCVVVALVGGGQEIHDGEAGLSEWGTVLSEKFRSWHVWVSPEAVTGGPSVAGSVLFNHAVEQPLDVHQTQSLHLSVSRRSHRAVRFTEWVNFVLAGNSEAAASLANSLAEFPIQITRDISSARRRLREFTDPDQRIGLLASSGAKRLRAEGIEVLKQFRDALNWPNWFLDAPNKTTSSNCLEVAATEFECQGLELDHACLCWGTDFVFSTDEECWLFRPSRGTKLRKLNEHPEGQFVVNKYRVLLTRAREALLIFVPCGDSLDPSRSPKELDSTASFLQACGAQIIDL